MKIRINKFRLTVPNIFLSFVLKKALENDNSLKAKKEVKEFAKLIAKELKEFKKRNGSLTLVDIIDKDDIIKIVL